MPSKLDGPLNKAPIDAETRSEIIKNFWPPSSSSRNRYDALDWEPYFRYYARQCHDALKDQGQHVLARTHQDILTIVEQIQQHTPRHIIKERLRSQLLTRHPANEGEMLESSIDLAARLHLMMNIGINKYPVSGQSQLIWDAGSLKDFLGRYFDEPQVLGNSNIKLERMFTARNIGRLAGIQIKWTSSLADHLRMVDDDDKLVAIFHHASFLKNQSSTSVLPSGLIQETLKTLALLFPQHDPQTRTWLISHPDYPRIDKALLQCGQLRLDDRQIETFYFWHDRLVVLKQALDQSRPATLSQWWYDRRNGVQWYTFWVAALVLFLTVFFGVVQSVEGALQVYKAFHPTWV